MGVTKIRNEIEKNAIELIDSLKNICILHNLKRKLVILQIKHKKKGYSMERKINRIKVVLVEKGRTNKWLAERVGKDPATVSKWCTNAAQPTIEMLMQISKILDTSLDSLVRFEELPKTGKEL